MSPRRLARIAVYDGTCFGMEPTVLHSTLQEMDLYRYGDCQLCENRVLLDPVNLLHQREIDILAAAPEME